MKTVEMEHGQLDDLAVIDSLYGLDDVGCQPAQDEMRSDEDMRMRFGNNRKKVPKALKRARSKIAAKSRRINRK